MKPIFRTMLMVILCLATSLVMAQDAESIIKDYIKAVGGADKMAAITSIKMVGESQSPQGNAPMVMMRKAPKKSKTVITAMGSEMIFAYDGETAWSSNPWQGGGVPKKMEGAQATRFEEEEMEDPFLNYADKGHTVKFLGEEDVDDELHYKVRLTKKGGDEMIYYFNAKTGLPSQMKMLMTDGRAKGSVMVTVFGDYKEVNGLMMAHTTDRMIDGNSMGKFTISEMVINGDIPDSEFAFPEQEK